MAAVLLLRVMLLKVSVLAVAVLLLLEVVLLKASVLAVTVLLVVLPMLRVGEAALPVASSCRVPLMGEEVLLVGVAVPSQCLQPCQPACL